MQVGSSPLFGSDLRRHINKRLKDVLKGEMVHLTKVRFSTSATVESTRGDLLLYQSNDGLKLVPTDHSYLQFMKLIDDEFIPLEKPGSSAVGEKIFTLTPNYIDTTIFRTSTATKLSLHEVTFRDDDPQTLQLVQKVLDKFSRFVSIHRDGIIPGCKE